MTILEEENTKEIHLQKQLKLLNLKVLEHRLEKVWTKILDAGLHPILIKGWATALFYPNPGERLYVDFDLVFDPKEFEAAQAFTAANTLEYAIDLHSGTRNLDKMPFAKLYQNSVLKKCNDIEIRVPSDEDHLRILCAHWLNDGGAYKEKLWDIYWAVANRRPDFDWDKCLNSSDSIRKRWTIVAVGLAHIYLNLDISEFANVADFENIPKWVKRTVEAEWKDEVKLLPLHHNIRDPQYLWKQIKKRVPPNPIQSIVEMQGSIDTKFRQCYQITNTIHRFHPSYLRILQALGFKKR